MVSHAWTATAPPSSFVSERKVTFNRAERIAKSHRYRDRRKESALNSNTVRRSLRASLVFFCAIAILVGSSVMPGLAYAQPATPAPSGDAGAAPAQPPPADNASAPPPTV